MKIKIERVIFVMVLLIIFIVSYFIMNQTYNPLARYPFEISEAQHTKLIQKLSLDDINYIIDQKINPDQIFAFIDQKNFNVKNILWYIRAKEIQDDKQQIIVDFINHYRYKIGDYHNLDPLLTNYNYDILNEFYGSSQPNFTNASLASNPDNIALVIHSNETLYKYLPKDLEVIQDVPATKQFKAKKEMIPPLQNMCAALSATTKNPCGNLILDRAFVSYEDQIPIYEQALSQYGKDEVKKYVDLAGQSEFQLGYSIHMQPNKKMNDEELQKIADWLLSNTHKYGFILRYPQGKEAQTGKYYQPFTLRFIGIEEATKLYENNQTIDDSF